MTEINITLGEENFCHLEEEENDRRNHQASYTDNDADDEDDVGGDADDDDSSMSNGQSCDRISAQPLDLDGSIVVGGNVVRRTSVCSCSSHSSSSSRSSRGSESIESELCDDAHGGHEICESCARSSRGYSPTRGSSSSRIDDENVLPFPGFREITLFYLDQTTHPRDWCLKLVTNPWFERMCMMVILLNCVTLGMYQPCADENCTTNRCKILQHFDDVIFGFFAVEMVIKITAMGAFGKNAYLAETWNRLDFFIVFAGSLEYCLDIGNINLSAIRTIRVLRPLRAINRIPSMRILVMLLLDTLPMLGNVLLLCFFVFFIFGIVAVQLWAGVLRQRCFMELPENISFPGYMSQYYLAKVKVVNPVVPYYQSLETDKDYICSLEKDNGIHRCGKFPPARFMGRQCHGTPAPLSDNFPTNSSCINWNQYYTNCRAGDRNPFQGAISFDNIGLSWVAIFLVISLEGWTEIMYYVQDAHSFWDWIYFVLLIVVGSFFMINLCLVVIATQFSETKKREMERMRMERALGRSSSTLTSTNASEPSGCYNQLFKYLAHIGRRAKRKLFRYCRRFKRKKSIAKDEGGTCSISLRTRRTSRQPWIVGKSSMKNSSQSAGSLGNELSTSEGKPPLIMAPCASPEASDVDIGGSPRDVEAPQSEPHSRTTGSRKGKLDIPGFAKKNERESLSHQRKANSEVTSGSSRKTSRFTCAELLAIGATQGAAPAGFTNHFAMQTFYTNLNRNENHFSAPQLLFYSSEKDTDESRDRVDDFWTSDSDLDSESDNATDGELTSFGRCCKWYKEKQARLKFLVDHRYFQRGILTAILVNTLSMGIEYHNQPEELTLAVEISNVIFTVIFLMEMLMKMCAEGFFSYISSGYNLFDGVIVILSLVELCQSSGSGLSVLRTFRLLRILKLVRFMPALRRQLVIMLRTVDNVAVFFALLILFIFIFSILGMNLFGCKFCRKLPDGTQQCDRKNFDSLLWAIVTVFQILTQEDWNAVLFNGMERTSHWAALYFVALMTLGNYVLFNLLVAILVEGFSAEEDKRSVSSFSECSNCEKLEETSTDKEHFDGMTWISREEQLPKDNVEKEMKMKGLPYVLTVVRPDQCNMSQMGNLCFPPLITHTAATPQGSPNATLIMQRDVYNRLCPEKALERSDSSIISIDKSSSPNSQTSEIVQLNGLPFIQVTSLNVPAITLGSNPQNGARNSVVLTLSRQSSVVSNISRRSSLGFCFNRQRKGSKSSNSSNSNQTKKHFGSFHSWKSHRRKRDDNDSSENDSCSEDVVPNNKQSLQGMDYSHCNGSIPTLQNTSNNKRPLNVKNDVGSPRMLSPQNSIKSVSLSHYNFLAETNDRFSSQSRHPSLNGSDRSHCTLSPPSTNVGNSNAPSRQNSITGSLAKAEFKQNDLECPPAKPELPTDHCELNEKLCWFLEPKGWIKEREDYSLFLFSKSNWIRRACIWIAGNKWFDYSILVFIALNCITLAMERPSIPPDSVERLILTIANNTFTVVFSIEMLIKVLAKGLWYGPNAYFKNGWNVMDGFVVGISLVDVLLTFVAESSPRIFGILRVFRLLRSLRPLRVINRAPGLKLVVQTLLSSLRPIGNIVLICCTFFVIFGILGVQLFKGALYYCEGPNTTHVRTKFDCKQDERNIWQNRKYNFDNLGQALMALFVLSSKDGWVNIMYTGLDAVGVDQQPIENYNEWRLLYFISFLLLVAFFVLNMFVGVVVENFHRCREQQEREEKARWAAKRAKKMDKKRRKMREPPYYINYSKGRLMMHNIIISKYFDLVIAAVIGLNVITMAMEFYMMPYELEYALKVFNYFFTAVFILEACMKVFALGMMKYVKNRWNQLDIAIVGLSVAGIILEKMESDLIPINPTIIRVMRVLRIARVLKLLKMAKGIRALLDTVMQALPQVGNLGLLFFLLFFIFAALGVELFGRLECSEETPCEGLGEHAHFKDFGMAFLTLFRVATGDNWNGIMKDTLRENCESASDCIKNCCISPVIAPFYFVVFVLMAQFVLVNVVVAVLMKHLEESHKHMDDDIEMDAELEREMAAEAQHNQKMAEQVKQQIEVCQPKEHKHPKSRTVKPKPLTKMPSLPSNFIFSFDVKDDSGIHSGSLSSHVARRTTDCIFQSHMDTAPTTFGGISDKPSPPTNLAQNVNLIISDADDAQNKVTVADLSPAHHKHSFAGPPKLSSNASSRNNELTSDFVPASKNGVRCVLYASEKQKDGKEHRKNRVENGEFEETKPTGSASGKSSLPDIQTYKLQLMASEERKLSPKVISHGMPLDSKSKDQLPIIGVSCQEAEQVSQPYKLESSSCTDLGQGNTQALQLITPETVYNSSFTFSDADSENVPLIVRRLKKKLLANEGESSISSQSDIPENMRDKSFTTDSTSLEC